MIMDKSVQLDFESLPQMLQEDFSELEKYYEADDWFHYDITLENSVPSIKAFYVSGRIDSVMFKQICKRYGIIL